MIRVLMVVGTLNCGGAESLIMNLFRRIDRSKIVFDFAVNDDGAGGFFDKEVLELGGRIYHFPKYRIYNGHKFKKTWKKFFEQHKNEYQIIHTHHSSSVAIILKIAKKYGLYTVAHSHSAGWDKSLKGLGNRMLSHKTRKVADYFLACSYNAGVTEFGKKVCDDESRFRIVANGIESGKYQFDVETRNKIRKQLNIPSDVHVYGHVGRFSYPKNHQYLLKIFAEINKKEPTSYMLLCGDGELRPQIMSQIKELHLEDKVILAGVVNNIHEYLQAMDYFIFPSNYEGLPLSVVEAEAAGLKCLISDVITDEVKITDLVEYYSIKEEPIKWAEKVLSQVNYVRENKIPEIISHGFDVENSVKFLTEFYLRIIEKRNSSGGQD